MDMNHLFFFKLKPLVMYIVSCQRSRAIHMIHSKLFTHTTVVTWPGNVICETIILVLRAFIYKDIYGTDMYNELFLSGLRDYFKRG